MELLDIIVKEVKNLGACEVADNVKDFRDLVDRLFHQVGTPFCVKYKFPRYLHFKYAKHLVKNDERVFIDAGEVEIKDCKDVVLFGNTKATITVSDKTRVNKVMCYYGASAHIKVDDAVVRVYKIDAGDVSVEKIGNAIVLKDVTPENAEI